MIPVLPMRLRYSAKRPLRLPPYPGALWRSAFGKSLRDLSCITGAPQCRGCPALGSCGYGILFEPPARSAGAAGLTQHYTELPQPYILSPLAQQPGSTDIFLDLTLIGRASRRWREVLDAAAAIRLHDQFLQLQEARPLPVNAGSPAKLGLAETPQPPAAPTQLRLVFQHPLRLRRNNRNLRPEAFDFAVFFTALARRISMLHDQEQATALAADYRQLAAQAKAITIRQPRLDWFDWKRYSARQRRSIPMGGIVGEVTIAGEIAPLWPWLWVGQWLHVGKSAVMGLGRYRLEPLA